jgi:hypothetical protein
MFSGASTVRFTRFSICPRVTKQPAGLSQIVQAEAEEAVEGLVGTDSEAEPGKARDEIRAQAPGVTTRDPRVR